MHKNDRIRIYVILLVKWVKGFLSNRMQRVVIGDISSEWIKSGPGSFHRQLGKIDSIRENLYTNRVISL